MTTSVNTPNIQFRFVGVLLFLNAVLVFVIQNGTYDSGDSLIHFLQSANSLNHPVHFLDHWAKPIYILFSSPFTYFGWMGMKLFQVICVSLSALGAMFFFYKDKNDSSGLFSFVLCITATEFWLVQSSGLTEPLFAAILIWAIVALQNGKSISGAILFSLLPFVRSEGWLLIPVFVAYLIFKHRTWAVPLLFFGSFVYGVFGWIVKGNFLWFITENPYSGSESKYGSGDWFHFINQLYYVSGLPLMIFGSLGLVLLLFLMFKFRKHHFEQYFLVVGSFLGIVVSHTIFWTFGWFHSLGLNRVLLIIIPLFSVIAEAGWNEVRLIIGTRQGQGKKYIMPLIVLFLVVFYQLLQTPASIQKKNLKLTNDQTLVKRVLQENPPKGLIYFGNPMIPFLLDTIDVFDPTRMLEMRNIHDGKPVVEATIYWDNYFSITNAEVDLELVEKTLHQSANRAYLTEDSSYRMMVFYFRNSETESK